MRYLTADFGSTRTKLALVDGDAGEVLATASARTTYATDLLDGFGRACERLREQTGDIAHDRLLCCSSAAGGLLMVAVGLVPELTATAARMAAESAGAKVARTYSYELSAAEGKEIAALGPDIILLSGGTDGGNKEVLLANARLLARTSGDFAVIVAGNKSASQEAESLLRASGKRSVLAGNVMPVFGVLDIEAARSRVREIFIERIIEAKGLSQVQAMTDLPIVPTPLAVLKACELLSLGTEATAGIGDFLAVDLGGATTDIYSLSRGLSSLADVQIKGLPEPYAKRTVEGDLGMRHSAGFLLEEIGPERLGEECALPPEAVRDWVARCVGSPETMAARHSSERLIEEALAGNAISLAVERHCGVLEKVCTPLGETYTLTGKDLSEIRLIIGIGGVLAHSRQPEALLHRAAMSPHSKARGRMLPRNPAYALDRRYIFSAMGLIAQVDPELALAVLKTEIHAIPEGKS